jgi:very-short-patch-repair endonuclease
MTTRKTLALNPEAANAEAPALKKKGRGWEISESRLDALHEQAREMRRHSSEAHKALAEKFSKADLGRYTFKRFAVVGSAIVDFNCHNLGLALAIDEEGQNDTLAKRRDKSLESVGIKVMRIPAADILTDIDAVLQRLTTVMRERIAEKKEAARAHKAANPKQTYSRARPRGETSTSKPRNRPE